MQSPKPNLFAELKRLEAPLLFALLFLPGYMSQFFSAPDGDFFNNPVYLIYFVITALPQIFLVIYFIGQDPFLSSETYGLRPLDKRDLVLLPFALLGVFLALIPAEMLILFLDLTESEAIWETTTWVFSRTSLWPLVLLNCLLIGYLEESYFRSYLCTRLEYQGLSRRTVSWAVSLLFAAGHFYQGLPAFFLTFAIGYFMAWLFFRYRSLHLVALCHGMYNFTILMVSGLFEAI